MGSWSWFAVSAVHARVCTRVASVCACVEVKGRCTRVSSMWKIDSKSQIVPADYVDLLHDIEPSCVLNMDLTMCQFDTSPNRTST